MRLLFDIGHPAHVHYFRNLVSLLEEGGHEVLVTSREKDIALQLLDRYGIPFLNRGAGGRGALGKLAYMGWADAWMLRVASRFKPDVLVGFSSPYPAHAGRVLGRPYVGITDTEHSRWQQRLFVPFAKHVVTPACFKHDLGPKQVRFDSYMEVAYLAPKRFAPDPSVLEELGLSEGDVFTIVRFVGWEASHDRGHSGLSLDFKRHAVQQMAQRGRVFISSEAPLPPDLEQYRSSLAVDRMHDAMSFATLVYGESATMASEAAVLGTHAVYHDDTGRGYTDEQERRYGHVRRFNESDGSERRGLDVALSLLDDPSAKTRAREAAAQLLSDKIDTTDFLHRFVLDVATGA